MAAREVACQSPRADDLVSARGSPPPRQTVFPCVDDDDQLWTLTTSSRRTAALDGWLWRYKTSSASTAPLGRQPPAARLTELSDALGSYA